MINLLLSFLFALDITNRLTESRTLQLIIVQ